MKNSFKRLLGLIALFTLLFTFSCTEEFDVKNENEHQKNRNFEIKYKSFQQLMKEQKFNSAYTKVDQKIKTVKLASKTVMEEMYNFTIDTTVINEYHTNNYTSYNIGIIRDSLSSNYFENLFVEIDSSNVTTARILKYTINPISKLISSVETTPIIYNATSVTGKEAPGGEDCQTVSVYLQTQCGCPGHHWLGEGGCNCPSDPSTSTLLYSFTSCTSGGGGDVFDTGTLPSDPGTSILVTTTGGGSGSGSIAVPVVINYEKLRKNNLFKGTFFSLSERTWFFSQSEETQGAIMNYLESTLEDENGLILANISEYSLEAKAFVKELINDMINFPLPEGNDGGDSFDYNDYSNIQTQVQVLPNRNLFYSNFPKVGVNGMPSTQVYELVGGHPYQAHLAGDPNYQNACALRVSRALNYSGVTIPVFKNNNNQQKTEKGSDNKNYILDASSLLAYMKKTFPNNTPIHLVNKTPTEIKTALKGKWGIYIMIPKNTSTFGASGHADFWSNTGCLSGCYFDKAKEVYFWELF